MEGYSEVANKGILGHFAKGTITQISQNGRFGGVNLTSTKHSSNLHKFQT